MDERDNWQSKNGHKGFPTHCNCFCRPFFCHWLCNYSKKQVQHRNQQTLEKQEGCMTEPLLRVSECQPRCCGTYMMSACWTQQQLHGDPVWASQSFPLTRCQSQT